MTRNPPVTAPKPRRRPKDRKAQIARAAAGAFSALGYHAVSVETIAARVGISAPALYRHFASKYDLFRAAVLELSQQVVDATDVLDEDDASAGMLDQLLQALVDVIVRNRSTGGLYRWQARYLRGPDKALLMDHLRLVNHRLQHILTELRPTLNSPQLWMLSSGILSVGGSIVDHHVHAPDSDIKAVLTAAMTAVSETTLPDPEAVEPRAPAWRVFAPDAGVYEALLHAAMVMFARNGYTETSMAQIAAAVDLPVAGIYRYFPSKADMLATVLHRAADRLSAQLSQVHSHRAEPGEALMLLIDAYVATSFANPELASLYYSEQVSLDRADQMMLRNVQRSTIDSWVRLLTAARPHLDTTAARFLVHAAMSLVVDLGRLVHYDRLAAASTDESAYPEACVRALMRAVLFDAAT